MEETVSAALGLPGIVGWSGTPSKKTSSLDLKCSTFMASIFLMVFGKRLNRCAPLTASENSLALLTDNGACQFILFD